MNRYFTFVMSSLLCLTFAGASLAQNPPPPPEGASGAGGGGFGQPPQPGGFNQQPGDGFNQGRRGGGGGGGFGGERGGRGRGGPGIQGPDIAKFEMLRGYIEVVDRYAAMTRSADSAGVAAVISASDILRQRSPESATDFLTKLLPEVKIPAIERAIRIQLADLYRQSGQADKALEQLTVLMKAPN